MKMVAVSRKLYIPSKEHYVCCVGNFTILRKQISSQNIQVSKKNKMKCYWVKLITVANLLWIWFNILYDQIHFSVLKNFKCLIWENFKLNWKKHQSFRIFFSKKSMARMMWFVLTASLDKNRPCPFGHKHQYMMLVPILVTSGKDKKSFSNISVIDIEVST